MRLFYIRPCEYLVDSFVGFFFLFALNLSSIYRLKESERRKE